LTLIAGAAGQRRTSARIGLREKARRTYATTVSCADQKRFRAERENNAARARGRDAAICPRLASTGVSACARDTERERAQRVLDPRADPARRRSSSAHASALSPVDRATRPRPAASERVRAGGCRGQDRSA
jgi:hypothetical protein